MFSCYRKNIRLKYVDFLPTDQEWIAVHLASKINGGLCLLLTPIVCCCATQQLIGPTQKAARWRQYIHGYSQLADPFRYCCVANSTISRILRNFSQVALELCLIKRMKYFPPYLQHGRTIGLLRKITWPCED